MPSLGLWPLWRFHAECDITTAENSTNAENFKHCMAGNTPALKCKGMDGEGKYDIHAEMSQNILKFAHIFLAVLNEFVAFHSLSAIGIVLAKPHGSSHFVTWRAVTC